MGCACNSSSAKDKSQKFTVVKPNGQTYKVYATKIEADAAARRIGGKVK